MLRTLRSPGEMARAVQRLPVVLIVCTSDKDVVGAEARLLRLQLKGARIVSVLSPSMSRLMQQHGIDFEEVDDVTQLEQLHQTKIQYVLATSTATSEPSCTSALEMAAYSLVRACALQASAAMLANAEDATRWAASDAEAEVREVRSLAAKCLAACAQRDQRFATKMGANSKRVLIVGSGGREHALASAMSRSAQVDAVLVAPGNGGTALAGGKISNLVLPAYDVASLVDFARAGGVALVVVGPEQPLVDGLVDAMSSAGIPCFGPSARAAQLEASKAFSKDFMRRHGIRTADFRNFTDFAAAESYLQTISHRVVVKASGLAAGKGVLLPETRDEAIAAARQVMVDQVFGAAGAECVIEEHLEGEEVSLLAFCDGATAVGMPAAQDHKRVFDLDQGPNTGGMGAYAPAPVLTPALRAACMDVIQRTVAAMAQEGTPYHGVLYAGFMICKAAAGYEPVVLEYNCRFGDPETQAIMPLLEGDLFDIMLACVQGRLTDSQVVWSKGASCTVVCAAPGYPSSYEMGATITGLEAAAALPNVTVFHAGTSASSGASGSGGGAVTSGGRVLAVTGSGADLPSAVAAAYAGVSAISFPGMHHRSDIARRGLDAPLVLGVLGSTRGTALQAVIDAIASGTLHARIAVVVSNKKESGILERAAKHGLAHIFISAVGLGQEDYDRKVCAALEQQGVQLLLMVGYMRIVSPMFVSRFRNRCFNVHPSLLPDFAGGMDLQVHAAVLAAGKTKSGCTIHFVTDEVDGGPIVLQEECSVEAGETPESLKAKVQALEGNAFCRAIEMYRTGVVGPLCGPAGGAREVITYRAAGVDIDAGEDLVEAIKPMCKATRRPGCDADLGGFGGLFDLSLAGYDAKETILVSGTDGVGTKLKIAHAVGIHDSIGIDLVAMCVNDILVCGAEPLFFLDYYATGALEVGVATKVVRGIAEGCRQSGAALIGGETAEMAGMYQNGEYDLAGFSVGAVRRSDILPRGVAAGDVLIGLKSSGIHSNGYSLVRRCVERSGLAWGDAPPFSSEHATLGEALLTPTRIYVSALLPLVKRGLIKGMAHITGGGLLDNLPRVLPDDVTAVVNADAAGWRLSPVFAWLQTVANLPQHELLRTFNCGIGMVVVVAADKADEVRGLLDAGGEGDYYRNLGYLRARAGQEPQVDVNGSVE